MIAFALMADSANHITTEPWPSLETASWLFDRASIVLAASLIFGAAATVAIVWMGIIKEHHWDLARERANEKIAVVNNETARLSVEAETAKKESAQLRLQLLERSGPRTLSLDFETALEGKTPVPIEVVYTKEAMDGRMFAMLVAGLLDKSGWPIVKGPLQVEPEESFGGQRGQPSGITLVARSLGAPGMATLADAFKRSVGGIGGVGGVGMSIDSGLSHDMKVPDGTIRIVIGARP
jgi:hypothetical protein